MKSKVETLLAGTLMRTSPRTRCNACPHHAILIKKIPDNTGLFFFAAQRASESLEQISHHQRDQPGTQIQKVAGQRRM